MPTLEKTVTDQVREANRANSESSTGPTTEAGKKESSQNAVKHGKYAKRPDPVKRLLKNLTEEEEAARQALRAEVVANYDPPDAFAAHQAEALADLMFEQERLEGIQQVALMREREIIALEQRRRALRLHQGGIQAPAPQIEERGLANLPDSPGKFREMLNLLEWFQQWEWGVHDIQPFLYRLYGCRGDQAWRGMPVRWAVAAVGQAEDEEQQEEARQGFALAVKQEIEMVRQELAQCELEQGLLSEVAQAARLAEAMNSRKWSWIRQQENFLERSIDRKVRILIDLRRDHALAERRAAKDDADNRGSKGHSSGGGRQNGHREQAAGNQAESTSSRQDRDSESSPAQPSDPPPDVVETPPASQPEIVDPAPAPQPEAVDPAASRPVSSGSETVEPSGSDITQAPANNTAATNSTEPAASNSNGPDTPQSAAPANPGKMSPAQSVGNPAALANGRGTWPCAPTAVAGTDAATSEKNSQNCGTKPLSHLNSAELWEQVDAWLLEELGFAGEPKEPGRTEPPVPALPPLRAPLWN